MQLSIKKFGLYETEQTRYPPVRIKIMGKKVWEKSRIGKLNDCSERSFLLSLTQTIEYMVRSVHGI